MSMCGTKTSRSTIMLTKERCRMPNTPTPGHACKGGQRRTIALVMFVVVTLAAAVTTWTVMAQRPYHFQADGVSPLTVTVPWGTSEPTFTVLAAPTPQSLPLATTLLSRPVRIEAPNVTGMASITFSYDPAALPAGAGTERDLMVVTYLEEYDLWLPAGAEVDQAAHTVTATTTHFSEWALAVTDPQQLRDEKALADRLERSTGGGLAEWIVGRQDSLDCDPNRVLMPATVREPVALDTQLCQEVLDDGSYRLHYVNTSGMPRVMKLPAGFIEEQDLLEGFNQSVGRLMADRHPARAVVPDGGRLTVRFADRDIPPNAEITGDTDWSVYFVSLFRLLAATVLLDKAPEGIRERKLADDIDAAFLRPELWDCADAAADELRSSGDLPKAVTTALGTCLKEAIGAVVDKLGGKLGAAKKLVAGFLERRVNPLLSIPKLTELARAEMNGIMQAVGTFGYGLDTTVTIRPARMMSLAESAALPTTLWNGDVATLGCPQVPAGMTVPGAPASGVCISAVSADLDGNGTQDRLLLWRPPWRGLFDDGWSTAKLGAVALLDDGTFHLLEDPPATWATSEYGEVDVFDATQTVRLGADAREQVVVAVTIGANTLHHVVLSVGTNRRLRTVSGPQDKDPFRLFSGGGAGYSSGYGCVTSGGRSLLATTGSVTSRDLATGTSIYGWTREFYQLNDVRLQYVGREGGVAADVRGPEAGSDCSSLDPAARGPDIGPVRTAGSTPEETADGFVRAVISGDRSGVSRFLAGDRLDAEWAGGAGVDAWVQARIATQADRSAWTSAVPQCSVPEQSYGGSSMSTCAVTGTSGTTLYLRLTGSVPVGWTVSAAVSS